MSLIWDNGGPFLCQCEKYGLWTDAGEEKALGKTSHALREDVHSFKSSRRNGELAKHKRVSLGVSGLAFRKSIRPSRSSCSSNLPRSSMLAFGAVAENFALSLKILLTVFSFLNEHELLCQASPVCILWADLSTEAHANFMLPSGCADSEEKESFMISMENIAESIALDIAHNCKHIL